MNHKQRTQLLIAFEHKTEVPMLILSLIYVLLALVPDLAKLDDQERYFINQLIWLVWGIFATELGIKILLSTQRWRYLIQHWQDVLIVAMPFLRPLRFLRILFILPKTWRQTKAVLRQKTLSFIGLTSLLTVMLSSAFVYLVEKGSASPIKDYSDALWWAMTTITTVGYGDMYPVTSFGRGVAVFLMLTGITLFGLLTASVASFFVDDNQQTWLSEKKRPLSPIPRHTFHLARFRYQLKEKQRQHHKRK
ncbi:potassium channel family protein [Vibrio cincinnatiensis]|uniref:potassium channel family protein n=1 Tax=Vibrio cincinnatiensis TaxID=675 RepID=UPI001EDEB1CA|nr:potassium channel family protein [Vibrio cincinnatiensis]MCG3732369.1 potassium channel protein [Vibrio cincinnatiensis]MCG3738988.1 potassium channel protein [Vibrio cincinnatiensis]MCG3741955.1 potassium channel protein [Vibrio cincinnatiensis]